MSEQPIRVLVVDDHTIVRKGICALLQTEQDIVVVGEASDGAEAIAAAAKTRPDVVLMDLVMPGVDGVEATRALLEQHPGLRVLVLTSFTADEHVLAAIKAGAAGFHLKDADPEELVRAIHAVHAGQSSLDPLVARTLMSRIAQQEPETDVSALTPRELEVVRAVARGLSNQEVADALYITEVTVRTHVSNVLSKLGLNSRTQLALWALRRGVASLDEEA